MSKSNGKHGQQAQEARQRDGRASIIIAGPIRDGLGRMHAGELELFDNEANWRLTAQEIVVQVGGPDPGALIQSPQQAQQAPRQQVIFVPTWEITHLNVEGGYGAQFCVPHQQVRLRVPLRAVERKDRVTGMAQKHFMPYAAAAQFEAQQRRELPPIAPTSEPTEH